jgi:hypothetical protein
MAGIVVADTLQAASTSTLVLKNGVANTPPTVQDSAGTQIGTFCRAWVNFNGTTVTNPASMTGVRGSFNVSSILDNGTGDYTVNFTTAMPDANYSVHVTGYSAAEEAYVRSATVPTASLVRVGVSGSGGSAVDSTYVFVAIFR